MARKLRNSKQLIAHRENERRRMAAKPPEWYVWRGMKDRCNYAGNISYHKYGGKGIKVCSRWLEHNTGFHNFLIDMGPRPDKFHDLDREKSDRDYNPENCRWLPREINRSTYYNRPPQPPKDPKQAKQLSEVDEYDVQPEPIIE